MTDTIDLFKAADLARERLVRIPDHETSISAAQSVLPCRTVLQQQIVTALISWGPQTAGELEKLPMFSKYGPSTVRKRVSELSKADPPRVIWTGVTRDKMKEWAAL